MESGVGGEGEVRDGDGGGHVSGVGVRVELEEVMLHWGSSGGEGEGDRFSDRTLSWVSP